MKANGDIKSINQYLLRPLIGWLHVDYKGGKMRDIDLLNEMLRPLYPRNALRGWFSG